MSDELRLSYRTVPLGHRLWQGKIVRYVDGTARTAEDHAEVQRRVRLYAELAAMRKPLSREAIQAMEER